MKKTLIVYDSLFGNTEKFALIIADVIQGSVNLQEAKLAVKSDLTGLDLLILGSPTHGGNPSLIVRSFLDKIPPGLLKGISIAAFDTRIPEKDQNIAVRLLLKIIKYAAPKLDKILVQKGGNSLIAPAGFLVSKTKGPFVEGELERAAEWAGKINSILESMD